MVALLRKAAEGACIALRSRATIITFAKGRNGIVTLKLTGVIIHTRREEKSLSIQKYC